MKILVVLVRLLLVALAQSQEECREEQDPLWYYIYNTNIDIFYCFQDVSIDFECDKFNKAMEVIIDKPKEIFRQCTASAVQLGHNTMSGLTTHTLCKSSARVNLTERKIILEGNETCPYDAGYCYDTNNLKPIYWIKQNICQHLTVIYRNYFHVWTIGQNSSRFIRNEHISLLLTGKVKVCGVEMWKTDYDDVLVSESNVTVSELRKYQYFNSTVPKECNVTMRNVEITNSSKTWYIYKYPTNITVYFCVVNSTDSCEDARDSSLVNSSDLLEHCAYTFGNPLSSTIKKSSISLCETILNIDFKKDRVVELSPECYFSNGYCNTNSAFWFPIDTCGSTDEVYEGYEEHCGDKNCVIQKDSPAKFTLAQEGELCGEKVWYTDQDGFLVSEKELHKGQNRREFLRNAIFKRDKEISDLKTLLYCSTFFVIFCVVWYIFNVVVNFISLKKSMKMRTSGSKAYLMYCISQSLTIRYLRVNQGTYGEIECEPAIRKSHSNVSVENELYTR